MSSLDKKPTTNLYVEPSVFFRYPLVQIIICPFVLLAVDVYLSHPLDIFIDWSQPLNGIQQIVIEFIRHLPPPTFLAAKMILIFVVFEVLLILLAPGKDGYGPISPMGDRPKYRLNGVPCFVITVFAFFAGSTEYGCGFYDMGIVTQHLGEIIMTSIICCKVWAPYVLLIV
jgi:7-dehydrocholesterol reductase